MIGMKRQKKKSYRKKMIQHRESYREMSGLSEVSNRRNKEILNNNNMA